MSSIGKTSEESSITQDVTNITAYLNKLVSYSKLLESDQTRADQVAIRNSKQKIEISLIQTLEKLINQTDFAKQVQSQTALIDIPETVGYLVTFIANTTTRITPHDQGLIVDYFKKLLVTLNNSITRHNENLEREFLEKEKILKETTNRQIDEIDLRAQGDKRTLQEQLDNQNKQIEEFNDKLRNAKERYDSCVVENQKVNGEKAFLFSQLKDENHKLIEDNYRLSESEKALRQQVADLKQENKKTNEVDKDIITTAREELSRQDSTIKAKESQIRKLTNDLFDKDTQFKACEVEISHTRKDISALQNEIERVEKENDELKIQLDTCARHVDAAEQEVQQNRDIIANLQNNLQNIIQQPGNPLNNMGATAADISLAVTTAFKQLLSEEDKRKIPMFGENTKNMSFPEWLRTADRVAVRNGWTDAEKLTKYAERLEGAAKTFQATIWTGVDPNDQNIGKWKQLMREQFLTAVDKDRLRHQLITLKQKPEEPVGDFISKINELFTLSYGGEHDDSPDDLVKQNRNDIKNRVLSTGLLPKYRTELWNRIQNANHTFEELVKIAILAEQIVQRREIAEQSCLIAGIIEKTADDSKEIIEKQLKELETVRKDLGELRNKTTAHIEAVTAFQPQNRIPSFNSDRGRGRGRGRGNYGYNPRFQNQGYGSNYQSNNQRQGYSNFPPNGQRQAYSNNYQASGGTQGQRTYTNSRQNQGNGNFQPDSNQDQQRNDGPNQRNQSQFQARNFQQNQGPSSSRGRGGNQPDRTCYICQKGGHLARQCFYNPDNHQKQGNLPRETTQPNN
jgi:hypothetical protein